VVLEEPLVAAAPGGQPVGVVHAALVRREVELRAQRVGGQERGVRSAAGGRGVSRAEPVRREAVAVGGVAAGVYVVEVQMAPRAGGIVHRLEVDGLALPGRD